MYKMARCEPSASLTSKTCWSGCHFGRSSRCSNCRPKSLVDRAKTPWINLADDKVIDTVDSGQPFCRQIMKGATDWWLVSDGGEVELCLNEPGGEVDIVIKSALAAMTAVWTCQTTFNEAVKQGAIMVYGDPKLVKKLQDWLQSSALSRLGSLGGLPDVKWQEAQHG